MFLPGTGGTPGGSAARLREVAAQGVPAIGLMYPSVPTVASLCATDGSARLHRDSSSPAHSQGGGHAAMLACDHEFARVPHPLVAVESLRRQWAQGLDRLSLSARRRLYGITVKDGRLVEK